MKIVAVVLCMALAMCFWTGAGLAAGQEEKAAGKAASEQAGEEAKNSERRAGGVGQTENGVYECHYYRVKLPEGWTAIMPPTDQLGTVNAIFATASGSSVVTMIIGPAGGADAKTIADMFADQFKASRAPVLKNDQYSFSFPLQNGTAQAIIATSGDFFMVTTIAGNARDAREFLKNAVSSEKWASLLPRL